MMTVIDTRCPVTCMAGISLARCGDPGALRLRKGGSSARDVHGTKLDDQIMQAKITPTAGSTRPSPSVAKKSSLTADVCTITKYSPNTYNRPHVKEHRSCHCTQTGAKLTDVLSVSQLLTSPCTCACRKIRWD